MGCGSFRSLPIDKFHSDGCCWLNHNRHSAILRHDTRPSKSSVVVATVPRPRTIRTIWLFRHKNKDASPVSCSSTGRRFTTSESGQWSACASSLRLVDCPLLQHTRYNKIALHKKLFQLFLSACMCGVCCLASTKELSTQQCSCLWNEPSRTGTVAPTIPHTRGLVWMETEGRPH